MLDGFEDGNQFEVLYRAHYSLVVRTVYLIVLDRDVAQEITHEAFLRLWQRRDRRDQTGNARAWLMRVAVNLAVDHRRHWLAGLKHRVAAPPLPDPGAIALERLEIELMRKAVRRLKSRERAVLALRYEQGLSFPEIGRLLGRPEATVKTWLHRALDRLQQQLALDQARPAMQEELT